jgi:hypothetical protein
MRDILVTFDLENGTYAQYAKAYQYFGTLGLQTVRQGVALPNTVVVGIWYKPQTPMEIRNLLWLDMRNQGIPVSRLLVADFTEAAWFGPKASG